MNVSVYFSDTPRYGNFASEVKGWTDTEYVWLRRDSLKTDAAGVIADMVRGMRRAAAVGRGIHLNINGQEPSDLAIVGDVMRAAKPFWGGVRRVEVADEPKWSRAQTAQALAKVRGAMKSAGLKDRPLGIVFTQQQFHGLDGVGIEALGEVGTLAHGHGFDAFPVGLAESLTRADALGTANLAGCDWVGLEGYVDAPGSPVSSVNVAQLTKYLARSIKAVPKDTEIVLVGMAYARNGLWTNKKTLADLQQPTADAASKDSRVVAVNWFSYGRDSGARQIPVVAANIKRLSIRLLGKK